MGRLGIALFLFLFCIHSWATIDNPKKIGVGTWEVDKLDTSLKNTEAMGFGWHYNWRAQPLYSPYGTSARTVPFIPMIWDEQNPSAAVPGAEALLTFNEPDHTGQANMTVDQALALWPSLMARGIRLGSPAMAGNATYSTSWLGQFMSKAIANNYRVDFIAIHYYSKDGNVAAFKTYLETIYAIYKKPIWVTEWAMVDWSAPSKTTLEENALFAAQALEMLDDLPFVERHAWFAAVDDETGLNTEMFDATDFTRLTVVGEVFKKALSGTLVAPQQDVTVGSNLVVNGGFESSLTSWASWGGTNTLDTTAKNSGLYSLRSGVVTGGMAQTVFSKLTKGKKYRLKLSARMGNLSDQGWVGLKFYNAAGAAIPAPNTNVIGLEFSDYTFDFTVPTDIGNAYVYFWKNAGTSYLSIDDVSLFELATATATPLPAPTPTPAPPPSDTTAPIVSITSPTTGSILPRATTVTIRATATDAVGVTQVAFFVSGVQVCNDTSYPYTCSYRTPKQSGTKTIEARAFDAAGNRRISTQVIVQIK